MIIFVIFISSCKIGDTTFKIIKMFFKIFKSFLSIFRFFSKFFFILFSTKKKICLVISTKKFLKLIFSSSFSNLKDVNSLHFLILFLLIFSTKSSHLAKLFDIFLKIISSIIFFKFFSSFFGVSRLN